jgi:hypothetical protein
MAMCCRLFIPGPDQSSGTGSSRETTDDDSLLLSTTSRRTLGTSATMESDIKLILLHCQSSYASITKLQQATLNPVFPILGSLCA